MRWYVEPLAYDQRSFNAAALRLIDDLQEQVGALEAELERAPRASLRETSMRIAVCRPQVPFARGGAEIFTDALVDELRARGHEADLVSVPVQVVSGRARAHPGVPLAAARPRRGRRAEDRPRRRDEVPVVRRPSPEKRVWLVHQFRQAYELDGTELGQFGDSPEDRALRRQVQDARPRRARGGDPPLRDLAERRRPARALDRARRRGAAASAASARLPLASRRRGSSSRSSRLDRAKRIDLLLEAAAREPALEVVDRLRRA